MFHILVVDDDKNTRMFFSGLLESAGYTVTTSENGAEALSVMEKIHIDLVVLDIMMPKMDGYEFTRILRHSNNNLPIIMVSAKQLTADKHKGFLVGTDDYITKPIDDEEMLYRIKALLRRAKIANERKIEIGNVIIDYDSLTVSRKDIFLYNMTTIISSLISEFFFSQLLYLLKNFLSCLLCKIINATSG